MGFMRQVLDTLAEIQERHEAVKELEKGLMELHQIFLDMAVLVEAQGEMLDNIEQQVRAWCLQPFCDDIHAHKRLLFMTSMHTDACFAWHPCAQLPAFS